MPYPPMMPACTCCACEVPVSTRTAPQHTDANTKISDRRLPARNEDCMHECLSSRMCTANHGADRVFAGASQIYAPCINKIHFVFAFIYIDIHSIAHGGLFMAQLTTRCPS